MAYRATVFGSWYNRADDRHVYKVLSVGYGDSPGEAQAASGADHVPAGVERHKLVTCRAEEPELDPWDVFNEPLRVALEHAREKRAKGEKR